MRVKQRRLLKPAAVILAVIVIFVALGFYLDHHNIAVLEPAGPVGHKERSLIILAVALCAIVVIPVFAITIFIALRYREGNPRARKYRPDYDHSRLLELTWWGIPIIIITILGVVAWNSSHSLDPYRALASKNKTMTIQVIALDWKWLFIYPKQNVASVNLAVIPVNTPVDFQTTSDTVMNSFWVPALGGQIYSMPGMKTQLNLMASRTGDFAGSSANISGKGFAGMTFTVRAGSQASFQNWVKMAKLAPQHLTTASYARLAKPSQDNPVAYYSSVDSELFDNTIMKYMMPMGNMSQPAKPLPAGGSSAPMPGMPAMGGM